jgi:hypothetical protein
MAPLNVQVLSGDNTAYVSEMCTRQERRGRQALILPEILIKIKIMSE